MNAMPSPQYEPSVGPLVHTAGVCTGLARPRATTMPKNRAIDDRMPIVTTVLEREMYSEAEAARLLRVSQSTLNYWLEGGEQRGKVYQPIVCPEPRGGHPSVTWAEFVEADWLRMYRRTRAVPMAQLRAFIDRLREEYGVPYPLADRSTSAVSLSSRRRTKPGSIPSSGWSRPSTVRLSCSGRPSCS